MLRVGLISDTHGLLRPEAKTFLRGCDFIVHGGDIGFPRIIDELAVLAPVTAVRGNTDQEPWAAFLPESALLKVGDVVLYVRHDLAQLDIDPQGAGARIVVTGHSHVPSIRTRKDMLYVNPGSAGPRRFRLPVTIGELLVEGHHVSARTVVLVGENAT